MLLLLVCSTALAGTQNNCTTRFVGSTAYTDCQSQSTPAPVSNADAYKAIKPTPNDNNANVVGGLIALPFLMYHAISEVRHQSLENQALKQENQLQQLQINQELAAENQVIWSDVAQIGGVEFYRNAGTIAINGDIRSAMFRAVAPQDGLHKDRNGHSYHTVTSRIIVNCAEWMAAIQSQVRDYYDSPSETYVAEPGHLVWLELPPKSTLPEHKPGLCSL